MRQPFWVVYAVAYGLMLIAFWVVEMATESRPFATACALWTLVGLASGFFQTHTASAWGKGAGTLLWLGGLVGVLTHLNSAWQVAAAAGVTGDWAWLMVIAVVAVLVSYLVGRWWGEFYAALSFLVVPVLSIFGLAIPMIAGLEIALAFIAAMVVGLFLVATESLLIRWQKGQLGRINPRFLLSYCWRLAVTGSALVLTVGLLLVPPATFLHGPLSQQLMRLPPLPFARYAHGTVEFPDLFMMPGGPVNLPDTELFRVRGTTYPRWRVRTYTYYIGSGWRISQELDAPELPFIRRTRQAVELSWTPPRSLGSPITAMVASSFYRMTVLPAPGEVVRLFLPAEGSGVVLRTNSGCLQALTPVQAQVYTVVAIPIPETPEGRRRSEPLSLEERRALSYFPPYLYRVRELAWQVVRDARSPFERAKALETFLRTHYRYSEAPPLLLGRNVDVVSFFLFEAREGACDWFASALALMCRAVGIPTRVVTGFYSDEVDESGSLIIRANDAHAWVEAYIDGFGWIILDATPGDGERRSNLWELLQRWLSRRHRATYSNPQIVWWFIAVLWVLGALPAVWQVSLRALEQYRPRPRWQLIVHCYLNAVRLGRKVGLPLLFNATPWENAQACVKTPRFPLAGKEAFQRLADLVVAVLYAGEEPSRGRVKEAKRLWKQFRKQAHLYKRWFSPSPILSLKWVQEWLERV